jgi:NodT family efflux transporter outer membrane factor (OMF) lipoprotein
LGITLLAAACSPVGPDFDRPSAPEISRYTAAPLPDKIQPVAAVGGTAQSFAVTRAVTADWWALFHSDALSGLVETALSANPSLAAGQAALRKAQETVSAGRGNLLPSVTGSFQGQRERANGAVTGSPEPVSLYNLYNASVSVSYTPDIFGGTRRQIESLEAQADYQAYALAATYLSLTANVVTAAIQEASIFDQIAASEEVIAAEKSELEVVRRQFDLGAAARSDILAQEATLAQTEATLPPLRLQLAQTRLQIANYLGKTPNEAADSTIRLADLHLPDELPVSLPSKLVEQRPDIREAEAELHQAAAQVGVAAAAMLPQLKLTGSYGNEAFDIGSLANPANVAWNVGAGLTQPLFDGGTLLHEKRSAEAGYEQAASLYRSAVLTAFENVGAALETLQWDAETLRAQLAAEQSAADSYALSKRQYDLGAINYLTLLNAQRTLQQTKISLVQAEASRFADTAALFQALGGGWWDRKDLMDTRSADLR